MGNFRSEGRGGFGGRSGGSRFGGGRSFGDRDSGRFERRPLEMHDVTCDKCQKRCQVPFKPSGDKPVFCSECFRNEGGGNSFGSRDRGDRGRPERSSSSGMTSDQFKVLNVKLDKIIDILNTLEIDSDEDSDDDEDSDVEVAASDEELTDGKENDKDVKDESDDDLDDDDLDEDSEDEPKTA